MTCIASRTTNEERCCLENIIDISQGNFQLDIMGNRYLIEGYLSVENDIEYIQLFMDYESDDMPVVYFYEVNLKDNRFALRSIEVFADRTVKLENDLYCDVIEVCPIPTVDEFNTKVWGEGFYATIISKEEFDEIWNTRSYSKNLTAI